MSSRSLNFCGDADGFLAGHGVGDQQDLGRVDRRRLIVDQLVHHALVDVQAAGGVDDDRVVARVARRAAQRVARRS